jgi:prevent-host-death family protein
MVRVGIRELKQNPSAVLRRVKAGEAVEITERGRTVARIVPATPSDDPLVRLIAEGYAAAPSGEVPVWDIPTPPPEPGERIGSEVLAEMCAGSR